MGREERGRENREKGRLDPHENKERARSEEATYIIKNDDDGELCRPRKAEEEEPTCWIEE